MEAVPKSKVFEGSNSASMERSRIKSNLFETLKDSLNWFWNLRSYIKEQNEECSNSPKQMDFFRPYRNSNLNLLGARYYKWID
jgi:hypothetical protein